jgi:hypothetical protein
MASRDAVILFITDLSSCMFKDTKKRRCTHIREAGQVPMALKVITTVSLKERISKIS